MKRILAVATALLVGFVTACSDVPVTAPVTSVSEIKPRAFAVCAFGEWQADGSCSGHEEWCTDHTSSSGAFCTQTLLGCDVFLGCGDGGSYGGNAVDRYGELTVGSDDGEPDFAPPAPERVNSHFYVLRKVVMQSNFRLDFTDQQDILHRWTLNWGLFGLLPKVAYDRENQGWDARYALNEFGNAEPSRAGEVLHWATNIPIKIKQIRLSENEYSGTFTQIGSVHGKCICYVGTW
jgi:hypothetical protein